MLEIEAHQHYGFPHTSTLFKVRVKDAPAIQGAGPTIESAIGVMVRLHHEHLKKMFLRYFVSLLAESDWMPLSDQQIGEDLLKSTLVCSYVIPKSKWG